MNHQKHAIVLAAAILVLAGCPAHSIEGEFRPSCMAYAGDSISLHDGEFVWDKFSDQVRVDNDGNRIDQFPDHPVKGTYVVDGQRVTFSSESGVLPQFSYYLEFEQRVYLLTADEMQEWRNSGAVPRCSLVFAESSSN